MESKNHIHKLFNTTTGDILNIQFHSRCSKEIEKLDDDKISWWGACETVICLILGIGSNFLIGDMFSGGNLAGNKFSG